MLIYLEFSISMWSIVVMLAFWLYYFYKTVQRNSNLWIVTNLRVIDEYGVLSSNSKESPLDKINNVTYHQSLWGKIFGYGDITIQTAAEIGSTTYSSVESPKKLRDTITLMQQDYKQQQIKKQASELANAMGSLQKKPSQDTASEIERLYDLMKKGILTEEEFNAQKRKILNQ